MFCDRCGDEVFVGYRVGSSLICRTCKEKEDVVQEANERIRRKYDERKKEEKKA